jgi:integrase
MPRRAEGLTAAKVAKAGAGRYGDGGGLYLLVRPSRGKTGQGDKPTLMRFWLFRYTSVGKMREMGLGAASATGKDGLSLADARARARKLADLVRDGRDPLADRDADDTRKKAEAAVAAATAVTFRDTAERYIAAHEAGWKNPKHRQQWSNTLRDYAYPIIGALPVSTIETGQVTEILEPIWRAKPETASRLRGRLEQVLDYAKVMGWRQGENPARWRGHLDHLLPSRAKIARVEHHAALSWREIGRFMQALAAKEGVAALALQFVILTAARSGEVRGAVWNEIDLRHATWTIPADRMKAAREHRVPLTASALTVLEAVLPLRDRARGDFVFPGARVGQPLSDVALSKLAKSCGSTDTTVHGFRSSFRDWAAETTAYPNEVAEAALAHTVSDKVEAAYRRGDLFEKRRRLMDDWATFCSRPLPVAGEVVPLRKVLTP